MKSMWSGIDSQLSLFIEKNVPYWLEKIAHWISTIADVKIVLIISTLWILYFIFRKKWRNAIIFGVSVGVTAIVVSWMKDFYMVLRPQNGFYPLLHNEIHPDSFPSGHASMAAAFFVALLIIYLPTLSLKYYRSWFTVVCIGAILLIGISRLILNVHWLSDVVIGWTIGTAIALLAGHLVFKCREKRLF